MTWLALVQLKVHHCASQNTVTAFLLVGDELRVTQRYVTGKLPPTNVTGNFTTLIVHKVSVNVKMLRAAT